MLSAQGKIGTVNSGLVTFITLLMSEKRIRKTCRMMRKKSLNAVTFFQFYRKSIIGNFVTG